MIEQHLIFQCVTAANIVQQQCFRFYLDQKPAEDSKYMMEHLKEGFMRKLC